jgi:putative lipoprotein
MNRRKAGHRRSVPAAAWASLSLLVVCSATGCARGLSGQGADEGADEGADRGGGSGRVSGTLYWRERIALRPGSVAEVWLLDTSLADAPARELAYARIENPGGPPVPFELEYDPGRIDDRHQYGLRATIRADGRLLFTTDTHYPVLTRGAGQSAELLLVMVNRAPSRPDASLAGTYWKLVWVDGRPYDHAPGVRQLHLKFTADDGRVSGFTGCNSLTGSYRTEADQIDLGQLALTRRACVSGEEVEAAIVKALAAVDRFVISGDTLQLLGGDEPLLAFEAVYP